MIKSYLLNKFQEILDFECEQWIREIKTVEHAGEFSELFIFMN